MKLITTNDSILLQLMIHKRIRSNGCLLQQTFRAICTSEKQIETGILIIIVVLKI